MLETIKSSTEISNLFANGRRFGNSSITLLVCKRNDEHGPCGRVAFVAGKKLGNAVWRNKAKRRMREICREVGGPWSGYDVIFIAKSSTTNQKYSKVLQACEKLVGRFLEECD